MIVSKLLANMKEKLTSLNLIKEFADPPSKNHLMLKYRYISTIIYDIPN